MQLLRISLSERRRDCFKVRAQGGLTEINSINENQQQCYFYIYSTSAIRYLKMLFFNMGQLTRELQTCLSMSLVEQDRTPPSQASPNATLQLHPRPSPVLYRLPRLSALPQPHPSLSPAHRSPQPCPSTFLHIHSRRCHSTCTFRIVT